MILFAGSANLDFVVRADHIPAPGETVLGRGFATYPGGKGANQAAACAKAGAAATRMLLALGNDDFAKPIEASLRDAGVTLDPVRVANTATGTAFICVGDDAQNAITVAPGANAALAPEHLPGLAGVTHLVMQLEIPIDTVTAYAREAKAQGVQVVLNAAPAQALSPELLDLLDILIVNQGELAALAPAATSVAQGMRALSVPLVITTLGDQGCCALGPEGFYAEPAVSVQAVDTTGAGDTFCGVLVASLSRRRDLAESLRLASAAAAWACTLPGAQSSIPSHDQLHAFLNQSPPASTTSRQRLLKACGVQASDGSAA